jgi:multisubunit Na+/H+ antiporter MnhC subunit
VSERRFLNQFQPQTLVIGTMLCYLDAIFGFLFGVISTSVVLALVTIAGLAIGGYGIANEKKWGYNLAVGAAVVQVLLLFAIWGGAVFTNVGVLLNFLFDAALVALLLHPMSRDYQRIWFK